MTDSQSSLNPDHLQRAFCSDFGGYGMQLGTASLQIVLVHNTCFG